MDSPLWAQAALQLLDQQHFIHGHLAAIQQLLERPQSTSSTQANGNAVALNYISTLRANIYGASTSATGGVLKSGTLKKLSGKSLSLLTHQRWCVLQGTALTYYSDGSESVLKGVLQLQGATVTPLRKGKSGVPWGRGYAFEITGTTNKASPRHVTGNTPVVVDATDSAQPAPTAISSAGGSAGSQVDGTAESVPLNPLHRSKSRYVWIAETAEERDEWVAAISRAAQAAAIEAEGSAWSRRFSAAKSTRDYRDELASFASKHSSEPASCGSPAGTGFASDSAISAGKTAARAEPAARRRPPLMLSADWVRVQMSAANKRGATGSLLDSVTAATSAEGDSGGGGRVFTGIATVRDSLMSVAASMTSPGRLLPFPRIGSRARNSVAYGSSSTAPGSSATSAFPYGGGGTASSATAISIYPAVPFLLPAPVSVSAAASSLGSAGASGEALAGGGSSSPLAAVARGNRKVARALHKREFKATEAAKRAAAAAAISNGGDAGETARLAEEAAAAEHLSDNLRAALAAVAAGEARRRGGHVPGDRVTLQQLDKDLARDTLLLNGKQIARDDNSDGSGNGIVCILQQLARTIASVVTTADSLVAASAASSNSQDPSLLPPDLAGQEARLLAFCRDVLVCSSRTTLGGDTYDAVELLFGCPGKVLVLPETVRGQGGGGAHVSGGSGAPPICIDVTMVHHRGSASTRHQLQFNGKGIADAPFVGLASDHGGQITSALPSTADDSAVITAYTDDELDDDDDDSSILDSAHSGSIAAAAADGSPSRTGPARSMAMTSGSSSRANVLGREHSSSGLPRVSASGSASVPVSAQQAEERESEQSGLLGPRTFSGSTVTSGTSSDDMNSPDFSQLLPSADGGDAGAVAVSKIPKLPTINRTAAVAAAKRDSSSNSSSTAIAAGHKRWSSSPAQLGKTLDGMTLEGASQQTSSNDGAASPGRPASAAFSSATAVGNTTNGAGSGGTGSGLPPQHSSTPFSSSSQRRQMRERAHTAAPLQQGHKALHGDGGGIAAAASTSHPGPLARLAVRVSTSMTYRLLCADLDDVEEAAADGSEAHDHGSASGDLGRVLASYERVFTWARPPASATVGVELLQSPIGQPAR